MSNPPVDPQAAQQALELLERVQAKVLLELWTTIMLCAGLAAIVLSQICQLFGLRRVAAAFVMIYGYGMTWVPAQMAHVLGYGAIVLGFAIIVKESLKPRTKAA
ncbi:MAG: hypothetical protein PHE83_18425 [Opitutaceae bacterium]|nr:hypothetical protein [Opitutaceae bacterium]